VKGKLGRGTTPNGAY